MLRILESIADRVEEALRTIPSVGERGVDMGMGADGTPTSQIDKIAENAVLMHLEENDVPLNVLSEEIGFVDRGAEETLVLDPIDGTTNSAIGIPLYTISMAVGKGTMNGMRVAYLRNLSTGETYTAEKGKGAFKDGERIRVKERSDPKNLLMMIYLGNGASTASFELAKRVKSSRAYGCASLEMSLVASGQADGFLMDSVSSSRAIRVVDIAASSLILREAGGEVYTLDGRVLDMPLDVSARSGLVAVGDRRVYRYVRQGLWEDTHADERPRYGVFVNTFKEGNDALAKEVLSELEGEDVVVDEGFAAAAGMPGMPLEDMDVDILVTVGGDGTMLRALQKADADIVGVNAGAVGFLTEIDRDSIPAAVGRLKRGEYSVDRRPKIRVFYGGEAVGDAMNEVVIHTDAVAKIRQFRVHVDESLAMEVRSDGIMLSTPTGSTGYALSLGASIMDARVNAWTLVPMAAIEFSSRPLVIPDSTRVTVECVMDRGCKIVIDGQKEIDIPGGSTVVLAKSPVSGRFIRFDRDFYSHIREKLVRPP